MKDSLLREQASNQALEFLKNYSDFRLGDIEAEQPHFLTQNMSEVFAHSVHEGVALLAACDALLAPKLRSTLNSTHYLAFENKILDTLQNGGRIILSGCGSSGRLCMRIENSFRAAIQTLGQTFQRYSDRVLALMTGGDYAVIRAVEFFEDFAALGKHQAEEIKLGDKDLLIGVTATGETASILGTAAKALDDGAFVYMLVCSKPDTFYDRLPRASTVYRRPKTDVLYLPCGPMALTGSTRMQSSTYEQAILAIALDRVLATLEGQSILPLAKYADAFEELTCQMKSNQCIALLAKQVLCEVNCYQNGGLITYFADEYMLDVLTDTTERSPTFTTPPFVSRTMKGQIPSWAFVKNPDYETAESWDRCFRRPPRCIEWDKEEYAALGLSEDMINRIPPIGYAALCAFQIGNEFARDRESNPESIAVWVGEKEPPASFSKQALNYRHAASFTLAETGIHSMKTIMDLFEHLSMKMLLNNFSTATMVRMGRVSGNWMTFLNISNKKLIDRAARIVSILCNLPYEKALEELFYTEGLQKAANDMKNSSTQETIRRLGNARNAPLF